MINSPEGVVSVAASVTRTRAPAPSRKTARTGSGRRVKGAVAPRADAANPNQSPVSLHK